MSSWIKLRQLGALGVKPGEILHTAESLFHDHKPANEMGLGSCWIWRRHGDQAFGAMRNPGAMSRYDFRFTRLAELATAHQVELRA